jgi:sec-independent protein translocase protein TatC
MAGHQTAADHLFELRRRILICVGVLFVGAGLGYVIRGGVIEVLRSPLHQALYYTSPTGSFEFVMRVCLLIGFLFALPTIIYNLLGFIEPAFSNKFSRTLVITVIFFSSLLTAAGVLFCYFVSLPTALHFFNSVGTDKLKALISIDQYFNFVFNYMATFALVFQLPLILLFIDFFTPLGPKKLGKYRKFVFVGAFAIALVIPSAPDPLSQVILAAPILVLYEISILVIRLRHRRRTKLRESNMPAAAPHVAAGSGRAQPPRAAVVRAPRPYPPRVLDLRDHALNQNGVMPRKNPVNG